MNTLKDVFFYIKPLWENRYGQVSLRAVLAIALTYDFIWHKNPMSDGAIQTEAILIAGLLGLTMFQNIQDKKTEADVQKTVIKTSNTNPATSGDMDDPDVQVKTVTTNIKK